ncbi:MAG: hypothetical protein HY822_06305 [Acidobacteria bacterium]|nr:hypothetical protein [Acidobacteriota bacterium]
MAVRTTVDIPEVLHDRLRHRAEQSGTSIRALIIRAVEQVYNEGRKGEYVTGPLVAGPGKLGPAFPEDGNPYDLDFS